ncbi:uncharacterized protein GGS22DRAFT_153679 [Annulohypoxylon maeteangense]|uniref:uncharacterized protein n=1 Tax=Annulohypoxylon maeteangense TaxID=1927788 RepID=UPI0020077DDC|nr:uncharacterized protein GGS22DRAFT_153679 [Annulohypoxylon maeteangense]KAI0889345.1 hypothetical protein GGS22DRAFT_153679 [Annulohypoxylon maeteangense]
MIAIYYGRPGPRAFLSSLSTDAHRLATRLSEEVQKSCKNAYRFISTQLTTYYQRVKSHIKSVEWEKWIRRCCWVASILWTVSILGLFAFLGLYGALSYRFESEDSACRSDDTFNPIISEYNAWAMSGFFKINLGFGNLTFTEAKVVDIFWDIIIGRGLQASMAFMSWHVFTIYVTTLMEFTPVTYAVFFTVFLQNEPTLYSTFSIVRAFISQRRLRSRIAMVFMIWSMSFLMVWPTIVGAMTGYTTVIEALVLDYKGHYIPFKEFQPIAYVIHDGWRVNLTANYIVSLYGSGKTAEKEPIVNFLHNSFCGACVFGTISDSGVDCSIQEEASNYVSKYGFFGLNHTASTFGRIEIPSPVLNISAFYINPVGEFYGSSQFGNLSNAAFVYSNQTYPLTYVIENGSCQPTVNRLKWGFSFIQVFFALLFLTVWTIGTSILWHEARSNLCLLSQAVVPKGWRPILILAENMKKEMGRAGLDACSLTGQELEDEIKTRLKGGSVTLR